MKGSKSLEDTVAQSTYKYRTFHRRQSIENQELLYLPLAFPLLSIKFSIMLSSSVHLCLIRRLAILEKFDHRG